MSTSSTLAIVGASLAGAKAAEGAREAGHTGRIVLIGEERVRPYARPPLSKDLLRGESDFDSAAVHPPSFYDDHDIELVVDRVMALHLAERRLELAGGSTVPYDAAVLTTGATPRQLTCPGMSLAGIHYLRTINDAVALHDAIAQSTRVGVVGAGWIGCEVAASARQMGVDVVMVDPLPVPLQRVVGDRIGQVFRDLHTDNGVEMRLGIGVSGFRGGSSVEAIVLDDGRIEPVDTVVVGIGVTPRTSLAESTPGIRVVDGVMVDERLETDVPGVFAAGDVANAWHPRYGRHVRLGHWANALNQGSAAGRNAVVGNPHPYVRLPYFYSDQYDLGLEYVGLADPDDDVVVRGDLDAREFIAFWLSEGRVTAAMNVNVWDVVDDMKAFIEADLPVDSAKLQDPEVPLADVLT